MSKTKISKIGFLYFPTFYKKLKIFLSRCKYLKIAILMKDEL